MLLSIVVCKLLRFMGIIFGRGSSFPGEIALKICPDVLSRVRLCENILAVTGSNGKTTTTELIAKTLQKTGVDVIYNKEGSNQIEGVATLILSNCSLAGRFKREALILESDERFSRLTFRYFSPKYYLITNLLRDQMTRNRHPEWIFDIVAQSISHASKLILNADDPLVASFGLEFENAVYYGINQDATSEGNIGEFAYDDGAFCPNCKQPLIYEYRVLGALGKFRCKSCQNQRDSCQFEVTAVEEDANTIEINKKYTVKIEQIDLHNIYNHLAAFAACAACGIKPAAIAQAMSSHSSQTGRVLKFLFEGNESELLISKHENSTSYNCSIAKILNSEAEATILIVVDRISRKYFTSETSWLWDISFERLNHPNVKKVILAGKYCYDLQTRFGCTDVLPEKILCEPQLDRLKEVLKENVLGKLFVMTCLADKDQTVLALAN